MSITRNGVFIVFEGIDGSGKSTQINLLADLLKKQAYDVVETREPTDGSYGRKIRSLYLDRTSVTPEEEIELFIKDRRQHIEQIIEPALSGGKIVLCDRYYFSTAAYQGAAGGDPDAILARHDFAPVPDLVIIIEIDPRISITRITEQRGDVLNDFEQLESLKVRTLVEALLRRLNIAANRERM
ncbi:MAG: dTMP kinase [Desulfofustis sp.]